MSLDDEWAASELGMTPFCYVRRNKPHQQCGVLLPTGLRSPDCTCACHEDEPEEGLL